jgi:hypothetical protein
VLGHRHRMEDRSAQVLQQSFQITSCFSPINFDCGWKMILHFQILHM